MQTLTTNRKIDFFFEEAINKVFLNPHKTSFVMDGPIGVGKSSNFLMRGSYQIAQCVEPVRIGNRMVRESLWAGVRESENSAKATFLQLLEGGIFSPEIMASDSSPVRVYGSHPAIIEVQHDLPDGTLLRMKIECHGFNNEASETRLRTREYMGGLVPEMQGIPYNIYQVLIERCGRWRTTNMKITKVIDGVSHSLTGVVGLCVVLCDINIPPRPHALYSNYYDNPRKDDLPVMFITPPSPLLHIPAADVDKSVRDKYTVTRFEGQDYVWVPNPKTYNMTRHFEEEDSDGNRIPWSGYNYWFNRLHSDDSWVRRYVIGIPDTVGGAAAIYNGFRNNTETVIAKAVKRGTPIYVGVDPGGYAAYIFMQEVDGKLHMLHEIVFEPSDKAPTRRQLTDFVFPHCRDNYSKMKVIFVPDPASSWLGKNAMTGQEEDVMYQLKDEIRIEGSKSPMVNRSIQYSVEPCLVNNQRVDVRVNSLGYFVDKALLVVNPQMKTFLAGLLGQYRYHRLKSGVISDRIEKENQPFADAVESAQYPAVNILNRLKKAMKNERNKNSSTKRVHRIKRAR